MSIVRYKKCLCNTLYIRYAGIVQRFVSTIELFHGDHISMQSYTLRSESDFFLAQRWTKDKRVQDKRVMVYYKQQYNSLNIN